MKLEWRPVSLGGPPISTSLTLAETDELRRLGKDADVLEIGSAFGYSAVAIGQVARSVVAVDPHEWLRSLDVMRHNLAVYGVADRVEIRASTFQQVVPLLGRRGFDLVWIDGDHEAAAVAHDVKEARKLLRPTGTLAVHDYGEDTCPGVREALDAWKPPSRVVDTLAIYGPGEW